MPLETHLIKTLMDVTGEPRVELAVLSLLKDAVEHRMEKIHKEIQRYEEKYGMNFHTFREKFQRGEMEDCYTYEVETDYLEWEGLITRLQKYEEVLRNIP